MSPTPFHLSMHMWTKKYLFLVRSTKTRKSNNLMHRFLLLKIDYEFFRVIGVKYGNKSLPIFEIFIFSLLPFIVPRYYYQIIPNIALTSWEL